MAMLEQDSIVAAMGRLIERTASGDQKWSRYENAEDEYVSSTSLFRYYVSSRDDDGEAPYEFEIYRYVADEGKSLKVGEYETTSSGQPEGRERNLMLERLYASAKASAWGIDHLDDDLLKDLS